MEAREYKHSGKPGSTGKVVYPWSDEFLKILRLTVLGFPRRGSETHQDAGDFIGVMAG